MGELTDLLHLFALGIPGWLLFQRLRLPGAAILGPMVIVGLCRVFGLGPAGVPPLLKTVLQVAIGLFIGLRVNRDTPRALKGMAAVALMVSAWWLATAGVAGWALYAVSAQLDLKTALLGSTPGGVAEMSLLAISLGADAPSVALLQFFRVVLVLVCVPALGPWLLPFLERLSGGPATALPATQTPAARAAASPACATPLLACATGGGNGGEAPTGACRAPGVASGLLRAGRPGTGAGAEGDARRGRVKAAVARRSLPYLRTVLFGAAGGALLQGVGFPAGGLVGSMLGVGIARVLGVDCAWLPMNLRSVAQVGLGGLIGLNFTPEMVRSFAGLVVPVLVLAVIMLLFGFLLAVVVRRITGWDIRTCVISTCAGGLTQMTATAEDLGADPLTVTMLHVVRLITIVALLPPLFALLLEA